MAAKTVGIALGAGGAKGLAHLPVLETLDRLGVTVAAVAGTSIGAIVGSLYATGRTGSEVREVIEEILATPRTFQEAREAKRLFGWIELLDFDLGRGHVLEAEAFVAELGTYLGAESFAELAIPTKIVAADFWERSEVVLRSGPLLPAISASFALPGVFEPVLLDGRVLIDGGCVNPVPFDLIRRDCDIVVAVDVLGRRSPGDDVMPGMLDAFFNSFQIAERTIAMQKFKAARPDIYIEAPVEGIRVLEFHKHALVYPQMEQECERLARELDALLAST